MLEHHQLLRQLLCLENQKAQAIYLSLIPVTFCPSLSFCALLLAPTTLPLLTSFLLWKRVCLFLCHSFPSLAVLVEATNLAML